MKAKRLISMLVVMILALSALFVVTPYSFADEDKPEYMLAVNKKKSVVIAYKKNGDYWEPYRAMACSAGITEDRTPSGEFILPGNRVPWNLMVDDTFGQYSTKIFGHILFHSVTYKVREDKSTLLCDEFNQLGTMASHGCVRLSVMDAKWIYKNCKKGTKVTIYSSDDIGPLGKPMPLKTEVHDGVCWDPTDPDENNPYFKMRGPIITINSAKSRVVKKGSNYDLLSGVLALNQYAKQKVDVQVAKIQIWNKESEKYDTVTGLDECGQYKITYSAHDDYMGKETTFKYFYLTVEE